MTLIPQVRQATSLPLLAAGGIASGRSMLAAFVLGAEGVQMGTRFALCEESSASDAYKQRCCSVGEGDTMLCLKKISPTRMVKNAFFGRIDAAEARGADADELRTILGKARAKKGIFEGDLEEGTLEVGQVASAIREVVPAAQAIREIVKEFNETASLVGKFQL